MDFFKKFEIGIYLLYNAMSTSATQQSESGYVLKKQPTEIVSGAGE